MNRPVTWDLQYGPHGCLCSDGHHLDREVEKQIESRESRWSSSLCPHSLHWRHKTSPWKASHSETGQRDVSESSTHLLMVHMYVLSCVRVSCNSPYRISTADPPGAHANLLSWLKKNHRYNWIAVYTVGSVGRYCNTVCMCEDKLFSPQMVISLLWHVDTWFMFGKRRRSFHVSPRSCST